MSKVFLQQNTVSLSVVRKARDRKPVTVRISYRSIIINPPCSGARRHRVLEKIQLAVERL